MVVHRRPMLFFLSTCGACLAMVSDDQSGLKRHAPLSGDLNFIFHFNSYNTRKIAKNIELLFRRLSCCTP